MATVTSTLVTLISLEIQHEVADFATTLGQQKYTLKNVHSSCMQSSLQLEASNANQQKSG